MTGPSRTTWVRICARPSSPITLARSSTCVGDRTTSLMAQHTPLLPVLAYYALWFKRRRQPAIAHEHFSVTHRLHLKALESPSDPVGRPDQWETCVDQVSVVAFIPHGSAAARLLLSVGQTSHSFELAPGIARLAAPLSPGPVAISALDRHGRVLGVAVGEHSIVWQPTTLNYNLTAVRRSVVLALIRAVCAQSGRRSSAVDHVNSCTVCMCVYWPGTTVRRGSES